MVVCVRKAELSISELVDLLRFFYTKLSLELKENGPKKRENI